jgi:UDP-3-O-[3-hydroxymyristoyl] glucosamine N-acyltransferase
MKPRNGPTEYCLREPVALSAIAERLGLELVGPDRPVRAFGGITTLSDHRDALITYVRSAGFIEAFAASGIVAAVIPPALREHLPEGRSALIAADAEGAYFEAFAWTADEGLWERLDGSFHPSARIAESAVVHDGVVVGEDVWIEDNAVILPNTWLDAGVRVQPNTTVGCPGFQVRRIGGRPRLVPHTGGVHVGEHSGLGANNVVDQGMTGEVTTIGRDTHFDNLIHIAHNVVVGDGVGMAACNMVSGSVTVGDGAWLGPNCSITHALTLGAWSYVGTGGAVVRDIPPHGLAYGNPAKVRAWICVCRSKLDFGEAAEKTCAACGRGYRLDEHPVLVTDAPP